MREDFDRWVRRESMQGGWATYCRLCGKGFRRTFHAHATNYADAEEASRAYAAEHLTSEAHLAALNAYFADEAPTADPVMVLLARAAGQEPPDERILRRQAARFAARAAEGRGGAAKKGERNA